MTPSFSNAGNPPWKSTNQLFRIKSNMAIEDESNQHSDIPIEEVASDLSYYSVLEISASASEQEIKKAYRRLCLVHHPDKQRTEEAKSTAASIFHRLQKAYETLVDAESRRVYDEWRERKARVQRHQSARRRTPPPPVRVNSMWGSIIPPEFKQPQPESFIRSSPAFFTTWGRKETPKSDQASTPPFPLSSSITPSTAFNTSSEPNHSNSFSISSNYNMESSLLEVDMQDARPNSVSTLPPERPGASPSNPLPLRPASGSIILPSASGLTQDGGRVLRRNLILEWADFDQGWRRVLLKYRQSSASPMGVNPPCVSNLQHQRFVGSKEGRMWIFVAVQKDWDEGMALQAEIPEVGRIEFIIKLQ